MQRLEIFGIRHHGPGSARSLLHALETFQPDCVLIEGPPDADALIPFVAAPDMAPPVALLVYNPKDLQQASFFPFAAFSPEWQAMLYALRHQIPVQFMDLPMSQAFLLRETEQSAPGLQLFSDENTDAELRDPFLHIATLAGYSDPERWWEVLVERSRHDGTTDIFPALTELMRTLRKAKQGGESRETLLREACMRQTIRKAQKDGCQRIAVVCGAWHAPALADTPRIKGSADAALLKGLKKVKTDSTWIPWSFDRLSRQSGYGAGVLAPAWYSLLFQAGEGNENQPTIQFLTRAAHLLRAEDIDSFSTAGIIDAARLADHLAVLRGTAWPGIEELREAAVTALCEGSEKQLDLIDRELVIGDVLGAVPDKIPVAPIKADFEAQVRSCRLERNTSDTALDLDLREAAHLKKSCLLHRLDLIGIPWGVTQEVGEGKQGRFHERWKLKWLPDYEIKLIEAGTWGNTVEEAAVRRTRNDLRRQLSLPALTRLLGQVLRADLAAVVPQLVQQLRTVSALAKDALSLADALPPLVETLRYGHARQFNTGAIRQIIDQMAPRLCIQLPAACIQIDEETAADIAKKIMSLNRAFGILQDAGHESAWMDALRVMHDADTVAPMLSGLSTRLLYDKGIVDAAAAGDAMHYHLSKAQTPAGAVLWLEGFLYGSGLLLLHHTALWNILDTWVSALDDAVFQEVLPLLRRAFSRFSAPERQKMLELAKTEGKSSPDDNTRPGWDDERVQAVMPLLRGIFGGNE